jgi:thiol-disulfide isomerase/thioredoxin
VVLIDIMSTRCPHCLLASTTLEQVKARYGDKVAILEVVLPPDNQQTIAKFVQTNNITVPVVCDMGQMTASYFKATPTTMRSESKFHICSSSTSAALSATISATTKRPAMFSRVRDCSQKLTGY